MANISGGPDFDKYRNKLGRYGAKAAKVALVMGDELADLIAMLGAISRASPEASPQDPKGDKNAYEATWAELTLVGGKRWRKKVTAEDWRFAVTQLMGLAKTLVTAEKDKPSGKEISEPELPSVEEKSGIDSSRLDA